MNELADLVDIHIVTADTRGTAAQELAGIRFKKIFKLNGRFPFDFAQVVMTDHPDDNLHFEPR